MIGGWGSARKGKIRMKENQRQDKRDEGESADQVCNKKTTE